MNGTYVFWLNFLQNDLTGWIQSNKRFDFSTIQTALEVLYRLERYYFMVRFLFLSTIFSLWRTVTHLAFLIFCGPLKDVSDYRAPRMGSARLLLIQMKNGLLN